MEELKEILEGIRPDIDFDKVNLRLEPLRRQSWDYLQYILK